MSVYAQSAIVGLFLVALPVSLYLACQLADRAAARRLAAERHPTARKPKPRPGQLRLVPDPGSDWDRRTAQAEAFSATRGDR